jgi:hypothetical protein
VEQPNIVAPAPLAPRTFKKSRRLIPSLMNSALS